MGRKVRWWHLAFAFLFTVLGWGICEYGPVLGAQKAEQRLRDLRASTDSLLWRADSLRAVQVSRDTVYVERLVRARGRTDTLLARPVVDTLWRDSVKVVVKVERAAADSLLSHRDSMLGFERALGKQLRDSLTVALDLGDVLARAARRNVLDYVGPQFGVGLDGTPYVGVGVQVPLRRLLHLVAGAALSRQ